jgi:hypothetical protein
VVRPIIRSSQYQAVVLLAAVARAERSGSAASHVTMLPIVVPTDFAIAVKITLRTGNEDY